LDVCAHARASRSNTSALLKHFLARADQSIARVASARQISCPRFRRSIAQ
jgi:hypothetical protein